MDPKSHQLTPAPNPGPSSPKPTPPSAWYSPGRLSPILTKLAHASAPFLSIFLVVHLSAPVVAGIAGSGVGSSVMLLGREYYQTRLGERYLLFLPFAVHVTSGVVKRVVLTPALESTPGQQKEQPTTHARPRPRPRPRPLTSLLSLTAYTSLLLFLPLHFFTHRLGPSSTHTTPELDLELPKLALHEFPVRSWALYAGLVGCVGVHWVEGAAVLVRGRGAGVDAGGAGANAGFHLRPRTKRLVLAALGIVAPVLAGVWRLSREDVWVMEALGERYREALRVVWVYRV
ncbi:hypothetical protein F5I97DRAFT_1802665 [Phlebopus sp. FC_14]|nr:hypothetical protein F5I97DRAFT_1802665 [Phlebopus sp. FC_14]